MASTGPAVANSKRTLDAIANRKRMLCLYAIANRKSTLDAIANKKGRWTQ